MRMSTVLVAAGIAALAGCASPRTQTASTDVFVLRGQVLAAALPGTDQAAAQVRRSAAERCGGGFVIHDLETTRQPLLEPFQGDLVRYRAEVACDRASRAGAGH